VHSKLQRRVVAAICGAVARVQSASSPRSQEGGSGYRGPGAGEAAQRSEAFLRQLLGPSLDFVAQFAAAEGGERRVIVAVSAGQAVVVRHAAFLFV
jgi:hypothetical protein